MSTAAASTDSLLEQTLTVRQVITKLLRSIPQDKITEMPPTWNNNAHWHAGHMVLTPFLLTYGIRKEPLPFPDDYRRWFAKGTTPRDWGNDALPGYDQLVDDIVPSTQRLFDAFRDRLDEPFPEVYTTSLGVDLRTPGQALQFSLAHDGIHLGLLLALKRALAAG